jgi:short-subunit dehydrogenase
MVQLDGKTVLLTGGSRGIGPIVAESLAKHGANIALAARSESALHNVAQHLNKFGTRILVIPVDLRQPSEHKKLIAEVVREFGKIDILINNAGLETEGAFAELSWPSILENIDVNLIAPMALTHLVLPEMLERKSGHIINISSIAAKSGAPYAATYSGTKAGLAEWTRALRLELAGTGIHFSTIFPGYIREVGMFAKFGVKSPWIVGSCLPSQVAKAVIHVIQKKSVEKIVNFPPLRYSFVINELSPTLGDWIMRFSGIVVFQRRKADK